MKDERCVNKPDCHQTTSTTVNGVYGNEQDATKDYDTPKNCDEPTSSTEGMGKLI